MCQSISKKNYQSHIIHDFEWQMLILGLNTYHGDSSACIVADGKLVAAVEEERFNRIKHWAGLPVESVRYCLKEAGVDIADVEHIAINRNPKAYIIKNYLYFE